MIKEYASMTAIERRFYDTRRRVCLPIHQEQIFNEFLNIEEQKFVEDGARQDLEDLAIRQREDGNSPLDSQLVFDWFCRNGEKNIARIAELRGMSQEELVLDFALEIGLLNGESEHRRLVKKFVGECTVEPCVAIKFIDNQLSVNQELVCSIKSTKISKLDHILHSFEDINWRRSAIDFKSSYEPKQVADAVSALNRKQEVIQFQVKGYTTISWRMRGNSD